MQFVAPFGDAFRIIFFVLGIVIFVFIYERPIRRNLNDIFHNRTTSHETIETARRRLLNEPFYMMALNLCIWIFAAFIFAYIFKGFGEPRPVVFRIFLISLNTGLVTAVMCFFLLEHVSQRHISRFFFPGGGLYNTSKTIRIRIVIRFLALLFACNIIPLLSFIQLSYLSEPGLQDTGIVLQGMRTAILTNSIFFIVVGLSVTQFVITNFAAPLNEIIQALKDIRRGNFDHKVIVRSNDEIGYTGTKEYEEVANNPERGFHFHTGRPLTRILGYKQEWLEGIPESAIESFAGALLEEELKAAVISAGFADFEITWRDEIFNGAPQSSSAANFGTLGINFRARKAKD